jgi:hypothetical protein
MTPERKKFTILSSLCISGIFICQVFVLRHTPHHSAFNLASFSFLLLNSWLLHRYDSKRRQRDTLIHLFPESPTTPKERP